MKMSWLWQTLEWLGNTLATRAVTFHIAILRAYTKNTFTLPLQLCLKERGHSWKQEWEFRQESII